MTAAASVGRFFCALVPTAVNLGVLATEPAVTPLPMGVRLLSDVDGLEAGRREKLDLYLPAGNAASGP